MYGTALAAPSRWGLVRRSIGVWLAVVLATGATTVPELAAATFFVNVATGSDGNTAPQAQSAATPWQTITRAITEATLASGDTISVAAGAYDADDDGGIAGADTETFPLFLVDGVAILGAGAGATTVRAPASTLAFRNEDTPLSTATRLSSLTIANATAGSDNGIQFEQSSTNTMSPEIDNVTFDVSLSDGIAIVDDGAGDGVFGGLIRNNTFNVADDGVDVAILSSGGGAATDLSPTLRNNTFGNGSDGVSYSWSGVEAEGTFSPLIETNTFTSGGDGILFTGAFGGEDAGDFTVSPTIRGNSFTGVGDDAISMSLASLTLEAGDTYTFSPTIVNNTITSPAAAGISLSVDTVESSGGQGSAVSHILIDGNTITDPGEKGIHVRLESFSADLDFDVTVANNTVTSAGEHGIEIIYTSHSDSETGKVSGTIAGNTVTDAARHGILITMSEFSSITGAASLLVAGNSVSGSGGFADELGIDVDFGSFSSASSETVVVRDNFVDGNDFDGMRVDVAFTPDDANHALVTCNQVSNNADDGLVQAPQAGSLPADHGGGNLASPGLNSFFGNADFDFQNNDAAAVKAESNWWGTTSAPAIDGNISDDDEGAFGAVDFDPPLGGPPAVTLDVPLTATVAVDNGDPGPSLGDEIEYTATIDPTGQCGCAALRFNAAIPPNADLVPGSVTTTQGAVLDEDPVTVHLGHLPADAPDVTITWRVIPNSGDSVASQAALDCAQIAAAVLSDDPATGASGDPTSLALAAPQAVVEIPVLDRLGLAVLLVMLLGAGGWSLRRRRRFESAGSAS